MAPHELTAAFPTHFSASRSSTNATAHCTRQSTALGSVSRPFTTRADFKEQKKKRKERRPLQTRCSSRLLIHRRCKKKGTRTAAHLNLSPATPHGGVRFSMLQQAYLLAGRASPLAGGEHGGHAPPYYPPLTPFRGGFSLRLLLLVAAIDILIFVLVRD